MADTPEQIEARFQRAQRALETFVQENVVVTLAGSGFVNEANALDLSRRLAALRAEYDRAGAAWAQALEKAPAEVRQ